VYFDEINKFKKLSIVLLNFKDKKKKEYLLKIKKKIIKI
jgi:hypothetical protein